MKLILTSLCLLLAYPVDSQDVVDSTYIAAEQTHLLENEKNTIQIFKEASPLVVSVDSSRIAADLFSRSTHEIPTGSGTGFIWDKQGHVVTNFHVVQQALRASSNISVTGKGGERLEAKVVGFEPRKDIAVLKVDGFAKPSSTGFKHKIANSKKLQVGQKVLAIGNPFGFEQTLTQGVVSAMNRSMPSVIPSVTIRNMVQTDASINPGNSGGPLIDSRGYLIGMNTSIISGSGSSSGIGFAVPSNTINHIVSQIIEHGEVVQPGLGIVLLDGYQKQVLARYGHRVRKGVVIGSVTDNGPAAKAGLKGIEMSQRYGVRLGDVIVKIDDQDIDDYDDLYNLLTEKKVGEKIDIHVLRGNKKVSMELELAAIEQTF